jgi:hypothetical protein
MMPGSEGLAEQVKPLGNVERPVESWEGRLCILSLSVFRRTLH